VPARHPSPQHCPRYGSPNALYYAKDPVLAQSGQITLTVTANTTPGLRRGRIILVAADDLANADLQLSRDSDTAGDDRYPDGRRLQLPPGSEEIAAGPETEQRC